MDTPIPDAIPEGERARTQYHHSSPIPAGRRSSCSVLRRAQVPATRRFARPLGEGVLRPRRLRDECLNETLFTSLRQARAMLANWQRDYNEVRPHSAHGGLAPASIRLPPCSPASSPLRAGFADGLRPGLTQAARDGADVDGRDGETPLD